MSEESLDRLRSNAGLVKKVLADEGLSRGESSTSPEDNVDSAAAFEAVRADFDDMMKIFFDIYHSQSLSDDEAKDVRSKIIDTLKQLSIPVDNHYTGSGNVAYPAAADRIIRCLTSNKLFEYALYCIYVGTISTVTPPPRPPDEPGDVDDTTTDDSNTGNNSVRTSQPESDYMQQLEDYLSYLADQFSRKVEEITVDDTKVLVPRPEFVRLRQARSNGTWLLSYDSIFGDKNNPWRGAADSRYQSQYNVPVADQEMAAGANPDDIETIRQLIYESVPRYEARGDEPGKPKYYLLMTEEDSDGLKEDIATLVGLPTSSTLLFWLRRELIKGADAGALKAMYADQQLKWAKQDAQPKEDLRTRRPVRGGSPLSGISAEVAAKRDRTIRSVKAFIRSEIEGLSEDEALARKAEILEKAKAIL